MSKKCKFCGKADSCISVFDDALRADSQSWRELCGMQNNFLDDICYECSHKILNHIHELNLVEHKYCFCQADLRICKDCFSKQYGNIENLEEICKRILALDELD